MVGKTTSENLEKYRSKFHSIRQNYHINSKYFFFIIKHILSGTHKLFFKFSSFTNKMKHGYESAAKTFLVGISGLQIKRVLSSFKDNWDDIKSHHGDQYQSHLIIHQSIKQWLSSIIKPYWYHQIDMIKHEYKQYNV